jgi:FkbM family methyltransferase
MDQERDELPLAGAPPTPASRPLLLRAAAAMPWPVLRFLSRGYRWRLFSGVMHRLGGWSNATLGWHCVGRGPLAGIWLRAAHVNGFWIPLGLYEPRLAEILARAAGMSRACVWDVGANIGIFSLLCARQGATVVALEPDAENLLLLRQHLAANEPWSGAVRVHAAAAGATPGRGAIVRTTSGAETRIVIATPNAEGAAPTLCAVVTLDQLAETEPRPSVVKVDVEGAEADVLAGASRLLRDGSARWIVEVHNAQADAAVRYVFAAGGYAIVDGERASPAAPYPAWLMATPPAQAAPR